MTDEIVETFRAIANSQTTSDKKLLELIDLVIARVERLETMVVMLRKENDVLIDSANVLLTFANKAVK